jgi:uncharacterized RDD family membrane protein YckC
MVYCGCSLTFLKFTEVVNQDFFAFCLLVMATRTARLFARFFDLCFCFILLSPSLFVAPTNSFSSLLCQGLAIFYWLVKDGLGGQSIGARFMNIGVMCEKSRHPCGFLRSIVRNGVTIIALPLDLLFWFRRDKRRLGDLIANTVAVREENLYDWRDR